MLSMLLVKRFRTEVESFPDPNPNPMLASLPKKIKPNQKQRKRTRRWQNAVHMHRFFALFRMLLIVGLDVSMVNIGGIRLRRFVAGSYVGDAPTRQGRARRGHWV